MVLEKGFRGWVWAGCGQNVNEIGGFDIVDGGKALFQLCKKKWSVSDGFLQMVLEKETDQEATASE